MKKNLKYLPVCLFIFLMWSCSTINKDMFYTSSPQIDNIQMLEETEALIVMEYIETSNPQKIKNNLDTLLSSPSTDSEYLAQIYALYADYYFLKRDKSNSKKMLKRAEKYADDNEYVKLMNSRFIQKTEEKCNYILTALKNKHNLYRLQSELANIYFLQEDYTKALVYFDSSLEFLPKEYQELYESKRAYCKKFYNIDSDIKKSSSNILEQNEILLTDMTILTQDNTDKLDFITGTAKWKPSMLADRLKASGWYNADTDLSKDKTKRKDAALFLWHMIAGNKTLLLSKYSRKYEKKGKSPIHDVPIDGVYFDSILGTVEEDIIPLIDGKSFNPDGNVSGLEFYNWLKKAEKIKQ